MPQLNLVLIEVNLTRLSKTSIVVNCTVYMYDI